MTDETASLADFFRDGRDITPFNKLAEWLTSVSEKRWTWARNSRCKYVTIKIDTRSGAYRIEDRDGSPISFAELSHQYGENPND